MSLNPALKPSTVLVVGARKFTFSPQVQASQQVVWWGATQERGDVLKNDGLLLAMVKKGLARAAEIQALAARHGAQCVEFGQEAELFPHLSRVLGIEPDPGKAPPQEAVRPRPPNIPEYEPRPPAQDLPLAEQQVLDVPVARIKRNPKQPRSYFNQERLLALGRSMLRVGQKVPVILIPLKGNPDCDYMIFDGERRWRAAQQVGKPTLRAIIGQTMSEAELYKGSAVCNFGREGHQPMEIARSLKQIKEDEKLTYQELAETFAMSVAWVTQHLSLNRMPPEVQALINPELPEDQQIRISVALEIAKVPLEHQLGAARHILEHKLSLPRARHYIRQLTAKVGVSSKRRERKPNDDYRVFQAFLERSKLQVGQFLEMPGDTTIASAFAKRSQSEQDDAVEELDAIIEGLKKIKTAIRKVGRRR